MVLPVLKPRLLLLIRIGKMRFQYMVGSLSLFHKVMVRIGQKPIKLLSVSQMLPMQIKKNISGSLMMPMMVATCLINNKCRIKKYFIVIRIQISVLWILLLSNLEQVWMMRTILSLTLKLRKVVLM